MSNLWDDDSLDTLDLRSRKLRELPGIERCRRLERLWLDRNELTALPDGLGALPALHTLSLSRNPLAVIDGALATKLRLSFIDFSETALVALPSGAASWPLTTVRLTGMPRGHAWRETLERIDPTRLVSLTIGGNPSVAGALACLARFTHLKVLHLNACELATLPGELEALHELETLSIFENDVDVLPDVIPTLPSLRSLVIGNNPGMRKMKAALKKRGVGFAVT
jgi:leucine-rich repeat protein SHOC2